ncbi:hypothetical protein [Vibrio alginolyticus]|uniref:hypothetical protein n=1 Tax=Vibrio alginolyticus TaxID=663 RepID=UPI0006CA72CB|nr:hypothetical protein [Vibrio alginolyticus]KPM95037.1 hypothetical protein AOG25_26450 [Vibrio alginolyticus]
MTISIEQLVEEDDREKVLKESDQLISNIQSLTKRYVERKSKASFSFSKLLNSVITNDLTQEQKSYVASRLGAGVGLGVGAISLVHAGILGGEMVGADFGTSLKGLALAGIGTAVGIYLDSKINHELPTVLQTMVDKHGLRRIMYDKEKMIKALVELPKDDFQQVLDLTSIHMEGASASVAIQNRNHFKR